MVRWLRCNLMTIIHAFMTFSFDSAYGLYCKAELHIDTSYDLDDRYY